MIARAAALDSAEVAGWVRPIILKAAESRIARANREARPDDRNADKGA